jgi:uncharacterized membrane protein YedE/YeeE
MSPLSLLTSTIGGVLLGTASSLLFVLNGRICGVSGIVGDLAAATRGDRSWRLAFIAGLLVGGVGLTLVRRDLVALASEQTIGASILAGVLVGVGTRMSHGCTSGHGLCGIARLSKRSIIATLIFMAAGVVTVFVTRHVLNGGVS